MGRRGSPMLSQRCDVTEGTGDEWEVWGREKIRSSWMTAVGGVCERGRGGL